MAKMTLYCEECAIGFDINFNPCIGLEVMKCVACPVCELEHTVTIKVDVEVERCSKCGSTLGHYPNCPNGICIISEGRKVV